MRIKLASSVVALIAILNMSVSNVYAAPIDLSSWSELTLQYPGGQPSGSWVYDAGNTAVVQVINADPSFFLNNLNQTSYSMDGTWQVTTSSDDDYMGFVFGYQNSSNFYLFDWKQGSQSYAGQTAAEGMTIKKFQGATGDGLADLSLGEFWENQSDVGDMSILATNHSSTAGWQDNVLYNFHLDFNVIPGMMSIIVKQGSTELWNISFSDSTFTSGQFGFYNFSQASVRYEGFEQTGGVVVPTNPVPEPGSMALISLGLAGIGAIRSRRG